MSEGTIPPPDAKPYLEARVGSANYRGDCIRCLWNGNGRNVSAQAVLEELHRRCHAAETERDAAVQRAAAMRERCAEVADKFAEDAEKRTRVHDRDDHDCTIGYLVSSNIAAAIRSLDDLEPAPKEAD